MDRLKKMKTIYVQLLNEGSEVYRPVLSKKINDFLYELLDNNYDPEDEEWEFLPGTIVVVEEKILSGKKELVAIKEYQEKKKNM